MKRHVDSITLIAIAFCLQSIAQKSSAAEGVFDNSYSPRYFVLTKSFTRVPDAPYKIWDHHISPPVHYPGRSACQGKGYPEFMDAAKRKFIAEVKALDGRSDDYASVFDHKPVVFGDGWPSDPLLTPEDAASFIRRYISNLNNVRTRVDYGEYAIHQVDFTFSCNSLQSKTAPVPPSKDAADGADDDSEEAVLESSGGIVLAAPPPETSPRWRRSTPEELARAEELTRKRAAATDVMTLAGAKDTPRNRQRAEDLAALRDRIQPKKNESCKKESPQFDTANWLWFYKMQPDGEPVIRAGMEARGVKECSRMTGGNPGHSVTNFQCVADGANADIYKQCSATIQCAGEARRCKAGGTAQ